ncbi:MAG: tetratricopeptide repeat protein, partial [Desulfobacterales bacterium]|nr:tetratricopeptide repeat protein [Desulfobacterales bacterium]
MKKFLLFFTVFISLLCIGCPLQQNKFLSQTTNISPTKENKYYYFTEAQLQRKRGNIDRSLIYMQKALELDNESLFLKKEVISLYLQKRDYNSALKITQDINEKNPDDIEALFLYGRIKQSVNNEKEAKRIYEQVLKKDPNQQNAYLLLGDLYLQQNEEKKALNLYRQMIKYFPNSYIAYFLIGKILIDNKELKDAEKNLKKSLDIEPSFLQSKYELIRIYKIEKNNKKVIEGYLDILSRDNNSIIPMLELSVYYHKEKILKKAYEIFDILAKRSISDPEILKIIVQLYVESKTYDNALIVLEGMLKTLPDNSEINYITGIVYEELKKPKLAITYFKKVRPGTRFYENAATFLALTYKEEGKLTYAISLLKSAISESRGKPNLNLFIYLSLIYIDTESYNEAEKILKEGLKFDPNHIDINFQLGVIYDKAGKKEKCIEQMKKVIQLDPKNPDALNYLGYTYADLGENLYEAEKLIKAALQYKPDDAYITDSLGWVYFKQGNMKAALKNLEKAVSLAPDDPTLLEHLGDVYFKMGNKDKALKLYNQSL